MIDWWLDRHISPFLIPETFQDIIHITALSKYHVHCVSVPFRIHGRTTCTLVTALCWTLSLLLLFICRHAPLPGFSMDSMFNDVFFGFPPQTERTSRC